MDCILQAFAKGCQYNFGFHVPFDCEIWQISDQKSVFGFAERNTPLELHTKLIVPRESTAEEVSFEWSHDRIHPQIQKSKLHKE